MSKQSLSQAIPGVPYLRSKDQQKSNLADWGNALSCPSSSDRPVLAVVLRGWIARSVAAPPGLALPQSFGAGHPIVPADWMHPNDSSAQQD